MRMWKEGAGDSAELLWVEEASPADLLAAVRGAVESGTIEGEVVRSGDEYGGLPVLPRGTYLVIPLVERGEGGNK